MKAFQTKKYTSGFCLNEQDVRRIIEITKSQLAKIKIDTLFIEEYNVTYKNGTIVEYKNLEEIFAQDNLGNFRISQVDMLVSRKEQEGANSSEEVYVHLIFSDPNEADFRDNYSIFYKVVGIDRDWVFITSSMIQDRIDKIRINTFGLNILKKSNNRISVFSYITSVMFIIYLIYVIVQPYEPLGAVEDKKESKNTNAEMEENIDYKYFENERKRLYLDLYNSELNKLNSIKINFNSLKDVVKAFNTSKDIKDSCTSMSYKFYLTQVDSVREINKKKYNTTTAIVDSSKINISVFSEKYPMSIYDDLRKKELERFRKGAFLPIAIIFGMPLLLYLAYMFFFRYYPLYNFLWGDYVEIYQKRTRALKIIISTLLSGVLLGIIVEKLANLF